MGKYIFNPIPFDTEVDAISSATITSKVVYDSFSDGQKILQLTKKERFYLINQLVEIKKHFDLIDDLS